MAHRNPWLARLAQHKKRWPVPLLEMRAQAYGVVMIVLEGVAVDDDEQRRKNILCYCQALSSFAKLLQASEYEARLRALEALSLNGHVPLASD
jgi:hypothetical protein